MSETYSWLRDDDSTVGILVRFSKILNITEDPGEGEDITIYDHLYVSDMPIVLTDEVSGKAIVPKVVLGDISTLNESMSLEDYGISKITLFNDSVYTNDFPSHGGAVEVLEDWLIIGCTVEVLYVDVNNTSFLDVQDALTDNTGIYAAKLFVGEVSDKTYTGIKLTISTVPKSLLELSNPIAHTTYADNAEVNAGTAIPYLMGTCNNVSPVLISESGNVTLGGVPYSLGGVVYQIDGYTSMPPYGSWIIDIFDVRENGAILDPSQYSLIYFYGLVIITSGSPAGHGKITCSASKLLTNPVDVIREILQLYGLGTVLDLTTFTHIKTTHYNDAFYSSSGVYVTDDSTSVLEALAPILDSISGYLYVNKTGQLCLGIFKTAQYYANSLTLGSQEYNDILYEIDTDMAVPNSYSIYNYTNPVETITINYNKNYTIHDEGSLAAILTPSEKAMLSSEWDVVNKDVAIQGEYKYVPLEGYSKDVMFSHKSAALEVASEINVDLSVERKIMKISMPFDYSLRIGSILSWKPPYKNIPSYVNTVGTIISITTNLKTRISTIEVYV